MKKTFTIWLIGLALPVCCFASVADVKGPEVWLEFMGGNVRKDGLRCDLEAIKDAGFSGVHFFHIERSGSGVWPGCPEQIPCMSVKWDDVMQFLGEECKRLDLKLTIQNCPGWSQSGGPWIDLDHCQRDIECARRDLAEGESLRLPDVPINKPGYNPSPTDSFTPSGILGPVFLRFVAPMPAIVWSDFVQSVILIGGMPCRCAGRQHDLQEKFKRTGIAI